MCRYPGLLGAWLIGATVALAQTPPSMESARCVEPTLDLTAECDEPARQFYSEVDFLLRWFKPVCETPAVITIGNPASPIPGALGQPGTQVVIGQAHKFEFPMTPGLQLTLGWDRGDGAVGVKFSGFVMEQSVNSQRFVATPDGFPNTYLSYQAPDNKLEALPFTIPGVVTGSSLSVGSTKIWGAEGDLTIPFTIPRDGYSFYTIVLVGGRYLDLTDRVRVSNALRLVADPTAFAYGADQFSTHNQFAGPQVGATLGTVWGRWSLEGTGKMAAGVTHQLRNIEGSPLLAASALSPLLVPGPLLALPSNVGRETARRVTLVPEIGLKSQVALASWCSLSFGYSLLYWNKVLCPGDQMSPMANITQLPFHGPVSGTLDPKPKFVHTDYFAQGLDFGLLLRF